MEIFDDIEKKIVAAIIEQLSVAEDKVTRNANIIDDLGADSLDTVELVMALEEEFDLEIPDELAEKIVIVDDVFSTVKKLLEK